MKRSIEVCLGEAVNQLGLLRFEARTGRERASFEYERSWLESENSFTIEPELLLVAGSQYAAAPSRAKGSPFPLAITDTATDGWARRVILRDWVKRRQTVSIDGELEKGTSLNSLDFLLAVDDFSRVGALRFRDETGQFQRQTEPGQRTAPPLIELDAILAASHSVEANSEAAADLEYLLGRATSLGGMRPKCSVIDGNGRLSIGKFPSISDERCVTKGEVLALQLAQLAGIRAAQARIYSVGVFPVALIERFDRTPDGKRQMYISASTMLGVRPEEAEIHCYTEIVDALRIHGADVQADIEELWRRILFSILISNVDDHLHNHGFLHVERSKWRLSPAFDINPFPDRSHELKTWISEDSGPAASVKELLAAASYFKITKDRAKRITGEVEQAVSSWKEVGQSIGMTSRDLKQYAPAFEHNERKVARTVL